MIKIIECPRDAMQGLIDFIPTKAKISYINSLLKVGCDTIDFGSFVSPKAIPQLQDTAEVLSELDMEGSRSKLLVIVGNKRGAESACKYQSINYVGYPHSVSPSFLSKNINSNTEKSNALMKEMLELCDQHDKELVVYLSMAFGNPYGDEWSVPVVVDAVGQLADMGVRIVPLSDTTGVATPENTAALFSGLVPALPQIEFGCHLHTTQHRWYQLVDAAYNNGCRRFDTVMLGLGGCPMAEDDLVGNLQTVNLMEYLAKNGVSSGLNKDAFENAYQASLQTFEKFID